MQIADVSLCLVTVVLVSLGQVMLRAAAVAASVSPRPAPFNMLGTTSVIAVVLYVSAMALWLYVLSRVPLTQAFAFFGLCFFLVPALANRLLGDPVNMFTWMGAVVIFVGVLLSSWQA